MTDLGKILVVVGLLIALVGVVVWFGGGKGWFSWFGRLPGDIRTGNDNVRFYFPLATSVIISVVLTLLLTFISWLSRK
jgi:hypothetical protein